MRTPLDVIAALAAKEERLVAGIMSGTSVDAVDVALVRIRGAGEAIDASVRCYGEMPFPDDLRAMLLANAEAHSSSVAELCVAHAAVTHLYAEAVASACALFDVPAGEIDLVGMHGQTVHHLPSPSTVGGMSVRSTLQLGSGAALAALLRTPVVSDFRSADTALGGQGAPILPYVDWLLFRSPDRHRILLNIGGIANITWLPAGGALADVRACDTGPGNMVCDALMRALYGEPFDRDGATARTGRPNPDLLAWMLGRPFFRMAEPKTAGRETFGTDFAGGATDIARELGVVENADLVATAAACTVESVAAGVVRCAGPGTALDLYISGGGVRNAAIVDGLKARLPHARVCDFADLGVQPEAREALGIAVLANEWLFGHPAALPAVTGAAFGAILGSFSMS